MVRPFLGAALSLAVFFCGLFLIKGALIRLEPRVGAVLRRAVGHPLRAVCLGALATGLIQSSSATNAMVVGLTAAGVLRLHHAFAVVLGSNLGTTLTGQVVAFGTYDIALPALAVGFVMAHARRSPLGLWGTAVFGLGGIFYGLSTLGAALRPLVDKGWLASILSGGGGDVPAFVLGAAATAVVQSSSAVTSILVGLAASNVMEVRHAIAAALGSNVGTVVTTILASLTGGTTARRTAFADLLFNLLGVIAAFPFLSHLTAWTALLSADPGRQVAHAHTLFNAATVCALLPFLGPFCRLVERIVPGDDRAPPGR